MMATATALKKPEIKTELPGPRGRAPTRSSLIRLIRARTSNLSRNAARASGSRTSMATFFSIATPAWPYVRPGIVIRKSSARFRIKPRN